MVVVVNREGKVLSHLLAMLRRRGSLLPPYIFSQGRIYGEGVYADEEQKNELFGLMLSAITKHLQYKMCLYIEFSDISKKMFGYRQFRYNGYSPVPWLQIHNSLHSMEPELRLDERTLQRINKSYEAGIITREATTDEEILKYHKQLRSYYRFRIQRYIPDSKFFLELSRLNCSKTYITTYKKHIVGGSTTISYNNNTYLWFAYAKNKSYPFLAPDLLTLWSAIKHSHSTGKDHIFFLNIGLPFKRNKYRDFILNFGGKPVSNYRWFHFTFKWMNRLFSWFYSE